MQYNILLSILFELLQNRRVTALSLSEKYGVSPRTVYRYVEKLSPFLPLYVRRGRLGGICLADSYKLPADFFTAEEYAATVDALTHAYERTPSPQLLSAKRKLASQEKEKHALTVWAETGEVLLLPEEASLAEKLRLVREGIREKRILALLYREGEKATVYHVEPHLLLLKKEWYLYAFCYLRREFILFPLEKAEGISRTRERFRPRRLDEKQILTSIAGMR